MNVTLRKLDGNLRDVAALQRVLEDAPEYTLRVTGHPVRPADAQSLFTALPLGLGYDAKHVFAVELDGNMVGVVDVLDGWPDPSTAHIGLLLVDEPHQQLGIGGLVWQQVETLLISWPHVRTVRAAVVQTNVQVLPFWTRCGFSDTGERKPYTSDKLVLRRSSSTEPLTTGTTDLCRAASKSTNPSRHARGCGRVVTGISAVSVTGRRSRCDTALSSSVTTLNAPRPLTASAL